MIASDTADEERRLWCAVIANTLDEAQGHVVAAGSQNSRDNIIAGARDWLTKPNRDFNTVCHLAGLDPMAVRERARRVLGEVEGAERVKF